jgi:hypothetical protein
VAGDRLVTAFSGPLGSPPVATRHWGDHRFTRYRSVMAALERFLHSYSDGYNEAPPATLPYAERIEHGLEEPYRFVSAEELADAQRTTADYLRLGAENEARSLDDAGVPRPPAALRTVPPV